MLKEWSRRGDVNTAPTWRSKVIHAINLSERVRTEFIPAGRQRSVRRAFLHAPPQSPTPWSRDWLARSMRDDALCRPRRQAARNQTVLAEENPALAHRHR